MDNILNYCNKFFTKTFNTILCFLSFMIIILTMSSLPINGIIFENAVEYCNCTIDKLTNQYAIYEISIKCPKVKIYNYIFNSTTESLTLNNTYPCYYGENFRGILYFFTPFEINTKVVIIILISLCSLCFLLLYIVACSISCSDNDESINIEPYVPRNIIIPLNNRRTIQNNEPDPELENNS